MKRRKMFFIAMVLAVSSFIIFANPVQAKSTYVKINTKNFPDAYLRKEMKRSVDSNSDGKLSNHERKSCTSLEIFASESKPIRSLKGIKLLPNLTNLTLDNVKELDERDLLCLPRLLSLYIGPCGQKIKLSHLKLDSLEVNKDGYLTDGICTKGNQSTLKTLICPKSVKTLIVSVEGLKYLNLRNVCNLHKLKVNGNSIATIETGPNNNSLKEVEVKARKLSVMSLQNMTHLKDLYMVTSKYYCINLSKNYNLTNLVVESCGNQTMNLIHNKKLEFLSLSGSYQNVLLPHNTTAGPALECKFYGHNFSYCNFNNAKNMKNLLIWDSKLKSMNLLCCTKLQDLESKRNALLQRVSLPKNSPEVHEFGVELSGSKQLSFVNFNEARNTTQILIDKGNLNRLDLSKLPYLGNLICSNMKNLKRVILPHNTKKRLDLDLDDNSKLNQCNFNDAKNVISVNIDNCGFKKLNFSKLTKIHGMYNELTCNNNKNLVKIILPKASSKAKGLYCNFGHNPKLSRINFNDALNLIGMDAPKTALKTINLSKLKRLEYLYCQKSKRLKKVVIPKGSKAEIHKDKKVVVSVK